MPLSVAILGWRLGLGWLLGRRRLLLTTQDRAGEPRRSLVPFRFHAGNLYVADVHAPWAEDLKRRPRATAQAHPGPLAVRMRQPGDIERSALGQGRWLVLEPTGDHVPPGIEADLIWAWVPISVLAAAFVVRCTR